jgi:hypothetical protein
LPWTRAAKEAITSAALKPLVKPTTCRVVVEEDGQERGQG